VSFAQINGQREAIYVALAAAELCWVTPVFVKLTAGAADHHPVLAWMGLLVIYLSYTYIYRALEAARLHVNTRQWVLLGMLLGQFLFLLKVHIYADVPVTDLAWLIRPFVAFTEVMVRVPESLIVLLVLIFLWWRGINLAQRSLTSESVGFSFRWGIVVFVWLALVITLSTQQDISAFVVPFFFFGLAAQALARMDEAHRTRGASPTRASPFWVAFTLFSVALLIGLGSIVAAFFYGGTLAQLVRWFRPLLIVVQVIVAAIVLAIVYGIATILSAVPLDLSALLDAIRQVVERLQSLVGVLELPPSTGDEGPSVVGRIVQGGGTFLIVGLMVAFVLLLTWYRARRQRWEKADGEERESMLSLGALARNLRDLLSEGLQRAGAMAGMIDRLGLDLLSALSIRRIYANLMRLAAQNGYPRPDATTPFEYLDLLYLAFPDSDGEVQTITQAYVNAHYGMLPDTLTELRRIRDAWRRVQQADQARKRAD
jgi:hypothetical protein